jgi:hypothetical protein
LKTISYEHQYPVKILTPFGLALFLLCANVLAQDDKPAGCLVAHFKGIGLRTNDDTQRARLAEEWLRKNISTCSKEQVAAIKSNSPDWLGTAHTHDVNMIIDASLEAKAKGNPKQIEGMYAALDNERKATTDNIGTPNPASPAPMVKPSASPSGSEPGTVPNTASKVNSLRQDEIAICLPNEIATWSDGPKDTKMISTKMVFVYDHQGAPDFISEASAFAVLQASASSWDPCGGSNMVVLSSQMDSAYTGVKIAVHWSDKDKSGTIGLANITQKILTFSPEVFRKLKDINAAKKLPIEYLMETLQMTASHEIGHFQGLSSHSKRCVDVLSYYAVGGKKCNMRGNVPMPKNVYEYRSSLPTACDIERCRMANKP